MKIAICLSGQMRTAVQAAPNIKRFIGELWDDCDFFIHTWDINQYKPYYSSTAYPGSMAPTWRPDTPNEVKPIVTLSADELNLYIQLYNPCSYEIKSFEEFKNSDHFRSAKMNSYLNYTFRKSILMCAEYSANNNIYYDLVFRLRPDIIFSPTSRLQELIDCIYKDNAEIFFNSGSKYFIPGQGNLIDDIAWGGTLKSMLAISTIGDPVFKCYSSLSEFAKSLDFKVSSGTLCPLACLRPEASHFDVMTQFNEIFEVDRWWYQPYNGVT